MSNTSLLDHVVFDATVSDRKILIVPIHTVRQTPYNPASRTKEGKRFSHLIAEIAERGLIYPILITSDRDVIDGNRRLAACRTLGHKTIECIVSNLDRDEAFTVVNTTSLPLGGKGWLEIGLGNGYMPPKIRQQYDELLGLVGAYGVKVLLDRNLGLDILRLCKQVAALDAKYDLARIIIVVAQHKLTNKVNFILRSPKDRESRVAAIDVVLANHV